MPEILQFGFMQRAFIAGLIVAIIAPLIGNFLVVRRLSLMADTLSHVALVGIAIGLLININPIFSAIGITVIAALAIEKLRTSKSIFGESALALFLSGSLALATVLISMAQGFNANLLSYLFGSITTITQTDVYLTAALGLIVIITIGLIYKELFTVSFDEELAEASGVKPSVYNSILMLLSAVTVAMSMRIVGVLLVGALMVIPVITAMKFSKSFSQTIKISIGISLLSVALGLTLSYYFNLASGGTIVLTSLAFFIASLIVGRSK